MTKTPDPLTLLVGEAIVAWSRVESGWAEIFFHLIYDDFGHAPKDGPQKKDALFEAMADRRAKRDRAAAIYFSVPSGRGQRRMVLGLAEVALKNDQDAMKTLRKLADKTDKLGTWRNQIAHAFYDQFMIDVGDATILSGVEMNAQPRHGFQDPLKEIPDRIREFNELGNNLLQMYLAIWGTFKLPEMGETKPKTNAKQPRQRRK